MIPDYPSLDGRRQREFEADCPARPETEAVAENESVVRFPRNSRPDKSGYSPISSLVNRMNDFQASSIRGSQYLKNTDFDASSGRPFDFDR